MLLAGPVSGAVLGAAALYASTREEGTIRRMQHAELYNLLMLTVFRGLFRIYGKKSWLALPEGAQKPLDL